MFIFARTSSVKLFPIIDLVGICSMHTHIERTRVDRLVVKVVELLIRVKIKVPISFAASYFMPSRF